MIRDFEKSLILSISFDLNKVIVYYNTDKTYVPSYIALYKLVLDYVKRKMCYHSLICSLFYYAVEFCC